MIDRKERVYLASTYEERHEIASSGAQLDRSKLCWYINKDQENDLEFKRWLLKERLFEMQLYGEKHLLDCVKKTDKAQRDYDKSLGFERKFSSREHGYKSRLHDSGVEKKRTFFAKSVDVEREYLKYFDSNLPGEASERLRKRIIEMTKERYQLNKEELELGR